MKNINNHNMKKKNLYELLPGHEYYINTCGLIVKENEQGPQPSYHSREILIFIEIVNEQFGKFEKKLNDKITVIVTRNMQFYDVYMPERELIYTKTMKTIFDQYLDDATSTCISKSYFRENSFQ